MNRLEKHAELILDQMQSEPEERDEVREELLTHLYSLKSEFIESGDSEKEAERKALDQFGGSKLVGDGLQETMYPHQRSLLYMIGLGTILFGVIQYLIFITQLRDPSQSWLFIQMAFGTIVTVLAMNISWLGRFYWLVNVLIFLTAGWNGFNYFVVIQFSPTQSIPLLLYIAIIVIISFIFMVRNAYFSTSSGQANATKDRGIRIASHVFNLLFGLAITAAALFFTWAGLAFSEFTWRLFLPLTAVIGWLIFYKYQMRLIGKKPVAAIFTGLLFVVLVAATPFMILGLFG